MKNTWFCTSMIVLTMACTAEPATNEDEANDLLPPEMSRGGMLYTPLRRNHPEKFVLKVPPADAVAEAKAVTQGIDYASLSDADLTRSLTSMTLIDGFIYTVTPLADELRTVRAQIGQPLNTPHAPTTTAAPEFATDSEGFTVAQYIIDDGKNWSLRRDNTAYPMSTIVQMDNTVGGCTGVMIGRSTMLTASHCFWDGQNVRPGLFTYRPGADIQDANPYPFGQWGCHSFRFANWTASYAYDYAVVDFRSPTFGCNGYPGDSTGYMGVRTPTDSALLAATVYLYGYPTPVDPYPQIWGMSGRIQSTANNVLWYKLDELEGHSGAPVYLYEGGYPHVIGINSGGQFDFGMPINRGARMTADSINFIRTWSVEY